MELTNKQIQLINALSRKIQDLRNNLFSDNPQTKQEKETRLYNQLNFLFRDFLLYENDAIKNIGENTIDFYNHLVHILITICDFNDDLASALICLNNNLLKNSNSLFAKQYTQHIENQIKQYAIKNKKS